MLQEWNQGSAEGNHLAWGNVHVIYGAHRHIDCFFFVHAGERLSANEVAIFVEFLVCLGNNVLGFAICGHVFDFVRYMTVNNLAVWRFDEAEWVDSSEGCQRTDKTDVWTFWGFDWAHTSEVGWVHVSNFHGSAVARKTTRAECGKTTLVRNACQWIVLIHKLAELGSSEEFLNSCVYWANVDQGLWSNCFRILSCHTFAHNALHAA